MHSRAMSEMVERVAIAISHECRLMGDGIGPGAAAEAARAAIAAMRQPTNEMLSAAYGNYGESNGSDEPARSTWLSMIDAAI